MMLIPPEGQPTPTTNNDILSLRQSLALELEGIRSNASDWKGASRNVHWSTKFITWLLKGML